MTASVVDGKSISEIYLKRIQLSPEGTAYLAKSQGVYHWLNPKGSIKK